MRTFYSTILALSGFATLCLSANAQSVPMKKSLNESCASLNFRFGKTVVDGSYMNNNAELLKMKEVFTKIADDKTAVIDSINIMTLGSPDGPYEYNKKLSESRAQSMKSYIRWAYPEMKQATFNLHSIPEDWNGLRGLIAADNNVPSQQKALDIIDSNVSSQQKENKLVALDGGKTHNYLIKNKVYAKLRVGASCTVWYTVGVDSEAIAAAEKAKLEAQRLADEEAARLEAQRLADEEAARLEAQRLAAQNTEEVVTVVEKVRKPVTMGIKTNLPLLAATVFNLGVEFGFGGRYSVDIPVIGSPWAINQSKYKFRVVTIQPEFRFWLKNNTKGSFFGVHAHTGWASIISPVLLNKNINYRSTDPMYGFGISYGYKFRLAKHWGLEGTIGAGYANIKFDALGLNGVSDQKNITKNYWGITRAQINLIYNFNLRK